VDNERLTRAVIEACRRLGVTFCAGRPATEFQVAAGRVERVVASYGEESSAKSAFSASHFVLAAGCWSGRLAETLGMHVPLVPCRGQMMEFEAAEELPLVVRAGHHYLVPRAGRRILAGTTAEYVGFEKAVTGEGLRTILEGVARMAPFVPALKFRRAWSGLRPDTPDHLPLLGRAEISNLLFATGHFRNGILLAPLTAQTVTDLILQRATPFPLEAYRPARFSG
jgi:glycine/D-amino acid oxidase-like deaminating enzyme